MIPDKLLDWFLAGLCFGAGWCLGHLIVNALLGLLRRGKGKATAQVAALLALLAAGGAAQEPVVRVELTVGEAVHRAALSIEDFADVPGEARASLPIVRSAFRPLVAGGGASAADLLAFGSWSQADGMVLEVLVANGRVDLYRGTVDGRLSAWAFGQPLVADQPVTIYDGGAVLLRFGQLGYHPATGFAAWYLRNGPAPLTPTLLAALRAIPPPADDIANTGAQGAPLGGRTRVVIGAYDVGLGLAALGEPDPASADVARLAGFAHHWTDQQARRSLLYYGPTGALWRALDDPGAIIGDHVQNGGGFCGLFSATQLHGRPAAGAGNPWRSFDHQHMEAQRLLVTWQATGSQAARVLAEAALEAPLSHPGVRAPKAQAFAGNSRAVGWDLRTYALAAHFFGNSRPQYRTAIDNLFEDIALSCGVAKWPYPTLAPLKADHAMMPCCVWQIGVLDAGMADAREVVGDGPDGRYAALHDFVLSCLLGPGRAPNGFFFGDYDPFSDGKHEPTSWVNSTSSWAGEWLLHSADFFPDRATELRGIAHDLQLQGLQAGLKYKPSEALGVYWRSTGAFGLPGVN